MPTPSAAIANTTAAAADTAVFAASTRSRFGVARNVGTIDPCRTSSVNDRMPSTITNNMMMMTTPA